MVAGVILGVLTVEASIHRENGAQVAAVERYDPRMLRTLSFRRFRMGQGDPFGPRSRNRARALTVTGLSGGHCDHSRTPTTTVLSCAGPGTARMNDSVTQIAVSRDIMVWTAATAIATTRRPRTGYHASRLWESGRRPRRSVVVRGPRWRRDQTLCRSLHCRRVERHRSRRHGPRLASGTSAHGYSPASVDATSVTSAPRSQS